MSWRTCLSRSVCLRLAASSCLAAAPAGPGLLAQSEAGPLRVPEGFKVQVFAEGLGSPWGMTFGDDGYLYVTEQDEGRVLRLRDGDGDGRADSITAVLRGLAEPAGIAWRHGDLWVAEAGRVIRLASPFDSSLRSDVSIVLAGLPQTGPVGPVLLFQPDGHSFLLAIGASCTVCLENDPRRGSIVRYRLDGSAEEVWASGLGNPAGLAFNPLTGELWATELGRGGLGADLPPDELNAVQRGRRYGWPYCYGARIPNPEYADQARCDVTEPPILTFEAHSSPLGIAFYDAAMFPARYRGDAFVTLHGSWDRSASAGYKVVRVRADSGRPSGVEDFLTGWLGEGGRVIGRPVQPLVGPDGSLYVSDDYGGRIWRIVYEGGKRGA